MSKTGWRSESSPNRKQLIELDQLPDLSALSLLLQPPRANVPSVVVTLPTLAGYDDLFGVAA